LCIIDSFQHPILNRHRPNALILIRPHAAICRLYSAFRAALGLVLAGLSLAVVGAPAQQPVVLGDTQATYDVWPAISILRDPEGRLSVDDVLAAPEKFTPPGSAYATLGMREKVVWLRLPMELAARAGTSAGFRADEQWILDVDYALLNRIDVHLAVDGRVVQRAVLGNSQPFTQRPMRSRSHAVPLELKPGVAYTLVLRVETIGAMILPVTLSKLSAFHGRALNEQILQGLLTSLGLCLLLYSLLQWASLRENMYLKYSLQTLGSVLFSVHFFGIGEMYLWTDNLWFERHMAGITTLIAVSGTALFVEEVLRQDMGRRLRWTMKALASVLSLVAVAHALDWMDIQAVSIVLGSLGLLPALLGIPGAFARVRRRDSVGALFLLAWLVYFAARAVTLGFVTGHWDANFWTMHMSQFGAALDMLIFMRIAVLRSAAIHVSAERATREHEVLHSLAHSDPLTGLLNRRGLNMSLAAALHNCAPEKLLVVYVLDLDGFKLVNDQFGHDAGDELLEIVASRLRASVRAGDGIARLGGDEFVVMAGGVKSDGQAAELGNKLLHVLSQPFALSRHTCHVSVTIGYTLAPLDGNHAETLLKSADAAMYAGKQAGKSCLRRAAGYVAADAESDVAIAG
jgi:diguanylate cyclase (GGDEF)-like protein